IGAWILVPLGVAGLAACVPRDRLPAYLVWLSFVPAYAVSVAIFFAADRYRLPLLVPLSVGTGAFLDRALQRRRAFTAAFLVAASLLVVVNWPVQVDDGRSEERTRMAEQMAVDGNAAA